MATARPRLPSAALHRHDAKALGSCCSYFEDCEADDPFSCRSWDRTRTPDASPDEIIGGRFEIQRSIGRGGAATMHQGKCLRTGKLVAIKSIPQESREDRKAALSEAAFLRSLDHDQINRLIAVVEDEFCVHLILEYAQGTDLMETLLMTGPMEEHQAAEIIRQLLEVLAYCHSHGVVHRDLKPENIMVSGVSGEKEITLVDLGLAREAGKELEEGEDEGTPVYLAPEVRSQTLICDGSLDMFSLGVVLFAMLSGRLPSLQATPALASLPEIPPGARDFLARLLVESENRLSAVEALEHPWLNAGAH